MAPTPMQMQSSAAPALSVRDLTIALPRGADRPHAVHGISFDVLPGQVLCLLGESGSGKSVIAQAAMGLLPSALRPTAGHITLVERYDDVHGVLDVSDLPALVPDLDERLAYGCGPAGLLDALEAHHAARGLSLTTERFRAVLVEPGDGGTVTFADGREIEADGATPILDAAETAGVLMPSGCRMGICMGCVVPLTSGAVRDLRNGAITAAVPGETGPGGVPIQTCISAAAGACQIDEGARSR